MALGSGERSGEGRWRDGGRMVRIFERRGETVVMRLHGWTSEEVRKMSWLRSRKVGGEMGRRRTVRRLGPARRRRRRRSVVGRVGRRRR